MVARNDEYGHGGVLQRVPQSLQTFGAVRAVEKIAGKKDQIAAFGLCRCHHLAGDLQQRGFQQCRLRFGAADNGGVQVPVSAV